MSAWIVLVITPVETSGGMKGSLPAEEGPRGSAEPSRPGGIEMHLFTVSFSFPCLSNKSPKEEGKLKVNEYRWSGGVKHADNSWAMGEEI